MSGAELLASATETALNAGPVKGRILRAAIYARVSSDPKNKGKSVADQITECRTVCGREGWNVVRVFEDNDRSASRYATKDRPKYEELIEFMRAGKCDVLVTWESSRFQRDLELYVRLRELSREFGVLWSYSGRTYDLDRMDDRLSTGLDALLAERESDQIRERVLRGIRSSALEGLPHAPTQYGYERHYDPVTKEFVEQVIREDQAAVVREAVRRVAAGASINSIVTDFNKRQLPTARGAKRWYHSRITRMVTNASYLGKRSHHGQIVADAVWPAILKGEDEERFYACVNILKDPKRKTMRDGSVKHLMSGLGRCALCDGPLRRVPSRETANYRCHYCGSASVRMYRLDGYITAVVCERLSRPDAADLLGNDTRAEESKAAMAEAAEKRARLDEFYDSAAEGNLTATALERIEARLLPEIKAAEERATDLRVSAVLRDVIRPDIAEYWPTLEITRQRAVIAALMSVRLLPAGKGNKAFDPARVLITWKHEQ